MGSQRLSKCPLRIGYWPIELEWHPRAHDLSINSWIYCLKSDTQTLHWFVDTTDTGCETLLHNVVVSVATYSDGGPAGVGGSRVTVVGAQWHIAYCHSGHSGRLPPHIGAPLPPRHSRWETVDDCWRSYQLPFWASHFANTHGLGDCTFALPL